jgi:hypothetical protein
VHVECVFEVGEHVLGRDLGQRLDVGSHLLAARPEAVDADAAGQLRDPGTNGIVVAQRVEPLVHTREHVLEDVLRVLRRKPKSLDRDGVDVAGKALDQLTPGLVVALSTAGDQGGVGELLVQVCAARSRWAIVSSSLQAIEAFDSTSGRNSHEVRP